MKSKKILFAFIVLLQIHGASAGQSDQTIDTKKDPLEKSQEQALRPEVNTNANQLDILEAELGVSKKKERERRLTLTKLNTQKMEQQIRELTGNAEGGDEAADQGLRKREVKSQDKEALRLSRVSDQRASVHAHRAVPSFGVDHGHGQQEEDEGNEGTAVFCPRLKRPRTDRPLAHRAVPSFGVDHDHGQQEEDEGNEATAYFGHLSKKQCRKSEEKNTDDHSR